MGSTSDGKVIEEVKVEGKAEQLWKKGEPDAEGYFTLQNSREPKVLTAISESSLEIKGNITTLVTLLRVLVLLNNLVWKFSKNLC